MPLKHNKRERATKLHSHWITYFYEVAQCGSIRRASRTLNVAPSAISRRLRELEHHVGARLLERVPKGLRVTPAGAIVVEHALHVLRGFGHMQDMLDELSGLERGHVTVSAVPSSAVEFLPKAVSGFRAKYPAVTFNCKFVGTRAVVEDVLMGDAEVGLTFSPQKSREIKHVASVPLPFGAIMAADHELAKRKKLMVSDLVDAGIPFIFPDDTISTLSIIQDIVHRNSLTIEPTVTSLNRDFVIGMTKFGGGIAIRTPVGIEQELREGSLVFVPLKDAGLKPRLLTVVIHSSRPLSSASSMFVEDLSRALTTLAKK